MSRGFRPVGDVGVLAERVAVLVDRVAAAQKQATDWADGSVQRAGSLDPKVPGGETSSVEERYVAANVTLTKSRVWTSRPQPFTDRALRALTTAVAALERIVDRILAEPNPEALGRQSQLVPCANRYCGETLDPGNGDIHTAGRCEPCATFRREHDRDRTDADIRQAAGNIGAGRCDWPDCQVAARGTPKDRLRTDPTDPDRRLCARHYKQIIRTLRTTT